MLVPNELKNEIISRFKEIGYTQVSGYNRFGYIRETQNSVIISREKGQDTPIPFSKIEQVIIAVRQDISIYSGGPSKLRKYGITHITSPLWSLIHLLKLSEIIE